MALTLTQDLAGLSNAKMREILTKFQRAATSYALNSGALAIGTTTTKVQIAAAIKFVIDGVYANKAITDDAFTLSGTVTADLFNVFVLTLKADGTATARMGTEGATRAAVVWPTVPTDEVVVGVLEINPTGTGNFVGGTTALGDATVVPNAVYTNVVGYGLNVAAFLTL